MAASPMLVRPALTDEELMKHVEGACQAFAHDCSPEQIAEWHSSLVATPGYRPEQVRGAYRDGEQLGGYFIPERMLRVGVARLATGCIGAVFTRPAYRKQGVATALMHDAIAYAREHEFPLLLLNGIPDFYYRYGYCDVFDLSIQEVFRKAVLALPPSDYSVRPYTQEDIASLAALYERQFGPFIGSFERSVEWLRHDLHGVDPNRLLLAFDRTGQPRGYLLVARSQDRAQEMAVDDWSAALALLQHQARTLEGPEAPTAMICSLPPAAPVVQWLADHLTLAEMTEGDPAYRWAVRETTFHYHHAAWMGRIVSLPALTRAMLPEWRARWRRSLARWSGEIGLAVDDAAFVLRIADTELEVRHAEEVPAGALRLTQQQFTQAIFGYRPISGFLQSLPDDTRAALNVLFPVGNTWIPRSDWF